VAFHYFQPHNILIITIHGTNFGPVIGLLLLLLLHYYYYYYYYYYYLLLLLCICNLRDSQYHHVCICWVTVFHICNYVTLLSVPSFCIKNVIYLQFKIIAVKLSAEEKFCTAFLLLINIIQNNLNQSFIFFWDLSSRTILSSASKCHCISFHLTNSWSCHIFISDYAKLKITAFVRIWFRIPTMFCDNRSAGSTVQAMHRQTWWSQKVILCRWEVKVAWVLMWGTNMNILHRQKYGWFLL
jgi:hypothetical protein